MVEDELKKDIAAVEEKVKEKNEAAAKGAESEFRKECQRDTAGTLLKIATDLDVRMVMLQEQLDAAFPIGTLARAVGEVATKLEEIDQRLTILENTTGVSE